MASVLLKKIKNLCLRKQQHKPKVKWELCDTLLTVPKFELQLQQADPRLDSATLDDSKIDLPMLFGQSGQSSIKIGRHHTNDVVLSDCEHIPLLISRFHVEFVWNQVTGEVEVYPQPASTNGTYVNNKKLDGVHFLRCGDCVSFGGPTYIVRDGVRMRNPFRYTVVESNQDLIVVHFRPSYLSGKDLLPPIVIKPIVDVPGDNTVEDIANMLVRRLNSSSNL